MKAKCFQYSVGTEQIPYLPMDSPVMVYKELAKYPGIDEDLNSGSQVTCDRFAGTRVAANASSKGGLFVVGLDFRTSDARTGLSAANAPLTYRVSET
jgi:hypothetical protein